MKKRRQHYIWRRYLKSWTTSKDQILCYRLGETFPSNLMGVGQERDFYKLKELTETDIYIIKKVFLDIIQPPELREFCGEWIGAFQAIFDFNKHLEKSFPSELDTKEAIDAFDTSITNMEENLHSQIEKSSIHVLDRLLHRDVSVFSERENFLKFCYFISAQFLRTKKMRDRLAANYSDLLPGFIERAAGVLRHIFASCIGWHLLARCEQGKLSPKLLVNNTENLFITSDQPVINMHSVIEGNNVVPSKTEFYYPISPRLAVLIAEDSSQEEPLQEIDSEKAKELNLFVAKSAHEQIFGIHGTDLSDYVEHCAFGI
ncbi:DUF4238 domain-containing protein [Shewanella algae]|uniref:DUF4238 domain-containing protein n=1 Tax=Shewanella algae TaxID=38313 RepID=UPI0011838138|nr:DUF4238 domain-containing protein [Shewanella algae]TVL14705.1 hypothetical protein AYJ02_11570 [Shewanella algae]